MNSNSCTFPEIVKRWVQGKDYPFSDPEKILPNETTEFFIKDLNEDDLLMLRETFQDFLTAIFKLSRLFSSPKLILNVEQGLGYASPEGHLVITATWTFPPPDSLSRIFRVTFNVNHLPY